MCYNVIQHHDISKKILPYYQNKDTLWIKENPNLTGEITESYCSLSSITLDCANFEPQPTYPVDENGVEITTTTFESNCLWAGSGSPREYTCNFVDGDGVTMAPTVSPGNIPVLERDTYCGVPATGSQRTI